jgi:hypothetical protein
VKARNNKFSMTFVYLPSFMKMYSFVLQAIAVILIISTDHFDLTHICHRLDFDKKFVLHNNEKQI